MIVRTRRRWWVSVVVILLVIIVTATTDLNHNNAVHAIESDTFNDNQETAIDNFFSGENDAPTSSTQQKQQQQQQQQQTQISSSTRDKPFETFQELREAVDLYLFLRHGISSSIADNNEDDMMNIIDQHKLTQTYGPIEQWDVRKIENFANLFSTKRNPLTSLYIDKYVDLSKWNTRSATNTQDMFLGCTKMDIDFTSWKVDRVTKFNGMFEDCTTFEGKGLYAWNVSNGKLFQSMFSRATNLSPTQFNITSWKPQNAQYMQNMFRGSNFGIAATSDADTSIGRTSELTTAEKYRYNTANLCEWYKYVPITANTTDMFRRSQCPIKEDPNLLTTLQQDTMDDNSDIILSFCMLCHDPDHPDTTVTSTNQQQNDDKESTNTNTVEGQQSTTTATTSGSGNGQRKQRPNVLFIMTDQQRYDAIRWVQDRLPWYNDGINTSNMTTIAAAEAAASAASVAGNSPSQQENTDQQQQKQFKIDTPNLDKLLKSGAYFDNAYTQCAVCAPARTTLRTGCTIERHGVQENDLYKWYSHGDIFHERVKKVVSIDQLLVEQLNYTSEYFGKWHIPVSLGESRDGSGRTLIEFNDFDFQTGDFSFKSDSETRKLRRYLKHFEDGGAIPSPSVIEEGQQIDTYTQYPYDPISLDSRARYNSPTNTPLTGDNGFEEWDTGQSSVMGLYSLSKDYTPTHFTGDIATRALRRLNDSTDPWFLTVSLHSPHPPMVPSWEFLEKYWDQRMNLHIPRNLQDDLKDSNYRTISGRIPEYLDESMIQELTAIYYALCEEVDAEVGALLAELDPETARNTLIVFTSDHGEMLGSHGKREKSNFYEEASKVPLMFSFPGVIQEGIVIDEKVSHLDVFATILDYIGASDLDESDGTSLRPMIENRVISEDRDQDVTFGEWDFRMPTRPGSDTLTRQLDNRPTNLVVKGSYKLMIHKSSKSDELDMMFDLANDPYEVNNLIGKKGMFANDLLVSKAEHLRCLLLDWMIRLDGDNSEQYFSDPANNYFEGDGDIIEVRNRQSWKPIGFWVSDPVLRFGRKAWDGTHYVRHEWFYMGTRLDETVSVRSIEISGDDKSYFEVDRDFAVIEFGDCVAVRVSFRAKRPVWLNGPLDAYVVLHTVDQSTRFIRLEADGSSEDSTDDSDQAMGRPIPSDLQQLTDPPLAPTTTTTNPSPQQPVTAKLPGATQTDLSFVSECYVCPLPLCLQRPDDIYPVEGVSIKCNDIEIGGKHLLSPISADSCRSLQKEMSSGVCGGCGLQGCNQR